MGAGACVDLTQTPRANPFSMRLRTLRASSQQGGRRSRLQGIDCGWGCDCNVAGYHRLASGSAPAGCRCPPCQRGEVKRGWRVLLGYYARRGQAALATGRPKLYATYLATKSYVAKQSQSRASPAHCTCLSLRCRFGLRPRLLLLLLLWPMVVQDRAGPDRSRRRHQFLQAGPAALAGEAPGASSA